MNFSNLKKNAFYTISSHFKTILGSFGLFTVISLMFSLLTAHLRIKFNNELSAGLVAAFFFQILTLLPLTAGLMDTISKISKNEKTTFTDFITYAFKNFVKIWKIYFRILLELFIISIIMIIITAIIIKIGMMSLGIGENINDPRLRVIIVLCYILYLIPVFIRIVPYLLSFFVLSEKRENTSKEIVNESKKLMKGNVLNYIILMISFIGWYILVYLLKELTYHYTPYAIYYIVNFLPTLLLTPYILASQYNFYEELENNPVEETEVKKSNEEE